MLHYFSKDSGVLKRSKAVLHFFRLAENKGIIPTMVLAESYATTRRNAGRDVAELRFRELVESGLKIVPLSQEAAREAGVLRTKYAEKIPWGDCLIAATHTLEKANVVLSEDSHFKQIREVRAVKLEEFKF